MALKATQLILIIKSHKEKDLMFYCGFLVLYPTYTVSILNHTLIKKWKELGNHL